MPLSRLGTTSWSLQPADPADLVRLIHDTGLDAVQLGLSPVVTDRAVWAQTVPRLLESNITLLSGMMMPVAEDYTTLESIRQTGGVRPNETWPANEAMARAMAVLASNAGISMVTMHAGCIPESAEDPEHATMLSRLRLLADVFYREGVHLAFETGQESAASLLDVLAALDHPGVGINFDPANMLLYGSGDPIEAMRLLSPYIMGLHLKDAVPSSVPGTWGTEMPLGQGAVDWDSFFALAHELPHSVDAVIEREGGDQRVEQIRMGVDFVRTHFT
ncbi:MAG: sugar phosphate isomerase/epimerase [Phycisphaerales bacterium]|nr:sugar phosphate isomerase/epimerase [Phycisphaerales bacterium]